MWYVWTLNRNSLENIDFKSFDQTQKINYAYNKIKLTKVTKNLSLSMNQKWIKYIEKKDLQIKFVK